MDRGILSLRTAVIATALLAAPGCSFMFSQGPPLDHEHRAVFDCGESVAPPVVDTIFAGIFGLSAARGTNDTSNKTSEDVAVAAGAAALVAASAVYGYIASGECRGVRNERAQALSRARLLPPPYGVPPYGDPPPLWPPGGTPRRAPAAPASTLTLNAPSR
jgi:hypothetical protein